MTKFTTYTAPDYETGFNDSDVAEILANHHPDAEASLITAWPRLILRIEITEPDDNHNGPW